MHLYDFIPVRMYQKIKSYSLLSSSRTSSRSEQKKQTNKQIYYIFQQCSIYLHLFAIYSKLTNFDES